jgi:hypothetical protein
MQVKKTVIVVFKTYTFWNGRIGEIRPLIRWEL